MTHLVLSFLFFLIIFLNILSSIWSRKKRRLLWIRSRASWLGCNLSRCCGLEWSSWILWRLLDTRNRSFWLSGGFVRSSSRGWWIVFWIFHQDIFSRITDNIFLDWINFRQGFVSWWLSNLGSLQPFFLSFFSFTKLFNEVLDLLGEVCGDDLTSGGPPRSHGLSCEVRVPEGLY